MKFEVTVSRSETVESIFTIEAKNEYEAEQSALKEAGDFDFGRASDAKYVIEMMEEG